MKQGHVIVGMSGGVDSSVAAYLLLQQGYKVEGLFMKNWEEDDGSEYCTALEDLKDARSVCERLNIPLHTANFAAEYWDRVFEHFLAEYQAGRTPNPDILCNKEIKFKAFLDYARQLGADFIATGHYARRSNDADNAQLYKAVDLNKDQSYFLHAVSGKQLARTLFPLGQMTKPQVRAIAREQGFINHEKKDSTGICFIGERRFNDFLERYIPAQKGQIVTDSGEVIGEHRGLMFYTLGQRQGINIGGLKNHIESPWYVVKKELATNRLIVAQGNNHPLLFSSALLCNQLTWICGQAPDAPLSCHAKTRYRQADQACVISVSSVDSYHVHFSEQQRAVTPGQYVVFYKNDECLGGGVIESISTPH